MFFETDLIRLGRTAQVTPTKSGSRLAEDYGVEGHLAALRSPAHNQLSQQQQQQPTTPSSVFPAIPSINFAALSNVAKNLTPTMTKPMSTSGPVAFGHGHGHQNHDGGRIQGQRSESPFSTGLAFEGLDDDEEDVADSGVKVDGAGNKRRGRSKGRSKQHGRSKSSSVRHAEAQKPPRRASKLIGQSADSLSTLSGKIQLSMMNTGLLPLSRGDFFFTGCSV